MVTSFIVDAGFIARRALWLSSGAPASTPRTTMAMSCGAIPAARSALSTAGGSGAPLAPAGASSKASSQGRNARKER